jgi:hypothetical protein
VQSIVKDEPPFFFLTFLEFYVLFFFFTLLGFFLMLNIFIQLSDFHDMDSGFNRLTWFDELT